MNNDCIGALLTVTSPFPLKWSNLTSPSHQYQTLYSFPFHQAPPCSGWITPFSGELYKRNRTFSAIYGIAMSSHRTTEASWANLHSDFCSFCRLFVHCSPMSDQLVWKGGMFQIHFDILLPPPKRHHKVRLWADDSTSLSGACRLLSYSKNRHLGLTKFNCWIFPFEIKTTHA